ncbi:ATP-binding protein [Nocardioides aequoreus]|uniref:ATP-binding protein n=1 Tax=Nocardioides aequoreus TaxID=397278 RepID=UPI0006906C72|nr:ATP-binding protein [Nocardioides aequoreus]
MRRLLLLTVVTWVAADLGYASFREDLTISLVWPVTGVALLWAGTGSRRTWPVDAVALLVVIGAALLLLGATWQVATMAGLQVVAQTAVHLALMTRLAPDLWGTGRGSRPMTRLGDLAAFLLATTVGATAGTLVRAAGLGLIPTPTAVDAALVWVRNFGWAFVIGAVTVQLAPALADGLGAAAVRRRSAQWWTGWTLRLPETALLLAITATAYVLVLTLASPAPVTFVLLLPTLWTALRLPPPIASLHALLCGLLAVLVTLAGSGVFAGVSDPLVGAAMAQAFMVSLMVISLAVSLVTSERVVASSQADERAALLTAVLEQIREGILVVRSDGEVVLRNAALPPLTGASGLEVGEPLPDVGLLDLEGRRVPADQLPHVRALRGEEVLVQELVHRLDDGEPRVLEISASRLTVDGEEPKALVVVRDVTLVRQREDALAAFAGVVAHDLNNPLTIVSGWADTLADSFAEGEVDGTTGSSMTRRIQDASAHMRSFIDDLLAYTIARDQPLRMQELDLTALAEQVATLRRQAPVGPTVVVAIGMHAYGDEVLVRQLLDNLVGNAVKYVADGVRPEVHLTSRARGDLVEVAVSDNGVGVPPHQRERIFETFVRVHDGRYTGTGIGLGICRGVVERHGGRIHVEDNPGGGSRFVFTLPAHA